MLFHPRQFIANEDEAMSCRPFRCKGPRRKNFRKWMALSQSWKAWAEHMLDSRCRAMEYVMGEVSGGEITRVLNPIRKGITCLFHPSCPVRLVRREGTSLGVCRKFDSRGRFRLSGIGLSPFRASNADCIIRSLPPSAPREASKAADAIKNVRIA
jgi:hypothetical protein